MFYKVLGFVVWQIGKRWLRRKLTPTSPAAIAAAGVAGAVIVGAAVAQSRRSSSPN